ncbi:MAG: sigma-70 family RNA polymerase sigma factor [Clostridiales bacterium]|nr:sigma-70 family RNA polymerase sigma factor [Clostridiales bacterium]
MLEAGNNAISDTELLTLLRTGDAAAERALYDRYKPVVLCHARAYFLRGGDREDLAQEGMIGLLRAVSDYNPQKGAAFRTFAELCIENQIKTAVTLSNRKKHAPLNCAQQLSESLQVPGPEDAFLGNERFDNFVLLLERALSPLERRALALYLRGLSYAEVAQTLGKPVKSVDNALARVRKKTESLRIFD